MIFAKTNFQKLIRARSDVSAESQRPVILKEQTVSNIVSTVSVLTTASTTASKRGASNHVLKGEQPIPPACLSSANGTSFSALPNADLGVNFYAPPPVVTTFSTPPMQNALLQRDYGTNSFFPRDLFSSAPNPSFHQQSVWSGAPGGLAGGVAFSHPRTNDRMVQPHGFSPVPQYPVLCYPGDNIFLPRPEFPKFNGDPLNFTTFKNEFVKYIVPKVSDHKMLLCYLLQHCETKVRDKIQHFSNKGDAGYALACERLEREYGRSNIIADACEQRLKAAKAVKSNDPVGLKLFSELLEQTLITLEDIRCFGSLSSLDTMAQLIQKLPFDSRRAWVKESVKVEQETGQVADFSRFVKFVNRLSDEANSLYGRRVLGAQSTKPPSKAQTTPDIRKSASSYNVTSKPTDSNSSKPATSIPFACFYCKDIIIMDY